MACKHLPEALPTSQRSSTVRYKKWDIFHIAYDSEQYQLRAKVPQLSFETVSTALESSRYMWRILSELCSIAPVAFIWYFSSLLWIGISPAISLYLFYTTVNMMEELMVDIDSAECEHTWVKYSMLTWLLVETSRTAVERSMYQALASLGGKLRAHFLPQLSRASLCLDVKYSQEHKLYLDHCKWATNDAAPALDFIQELCNTVVNVLALCLQLFVLTVFFLATFFLPTNGISGAGYTFWTDNTDYHRLRSLHSLAFNTKYRETLAKDNACSYVSQEYKRTSAALGIVSTDTWTLATSLPPQWHWLVVRSITIDYPLITYILIIRWHISASSLAAMAFLQYTFSMLRKSSNRLKACSGSKPLGETMNEAKRFYTTLANDKGLEQGAIAYPNVSSSSQGMKLSFRNVCLRYPSHSEKQAYALDNISFDIQPGQLVVVVGVNGSGKSSLLKLLPRLVNPTSGEIFLDDRPLEDYDIQELRRSITFLSQTDEIYPLSLRENILMGASHLAQNLLVNACMIDEAAQAGGCHELIERVGYDAIVDPPGIVGQSYPGYGNGKIGPGAADVYNRHLAERNVISISVGEKQRVIAARTFMRMISSDFKLLVLDESMPALDASIEQDRLNRFLEMRRGQTTILVLHHLGNIVKHADLILCMDKGKVVEHGVHSELIDAKHGSGVYATLCKAQGFR